MIALMILIFFLLQGFILLCCAAAGNDAASQDISDQEQLEFIQSWKEKNARKKVGILCECIAFFIYSYSAVFTSSEIIEK